MIFTPYSISGLVALWLKYKLVTLTFGGAGHQTRSLSVCSACFEGSALLKSRLSIRIRNFAAPNKPLNIFKKSFEPQSRRPVETLWCKNHGNPSDRKSHAWTPLM
jgi:hypothetical protein